MALVSLLLAGLRVILTGAVLGAATPADRSRRVMLTILLYLPGAAALAAAYAAWAR